ncbi:uncharacterized protein BJ212DRAFT_1445930 [Suillus subaureus]|uniref:Vacuolar import and degradation protein 21 n=1 Tax=Suillus subaureus TaxID=48587 RepID=A0A9P7JF33_9AGAM|nr:uncharacterized protein BJ212DRAFT_1445930 [Suillus subaureus]KAG1819471.1 hypothetical protein BJ212DRAFT_1445930 [Suillus subaureus]
MPSLSIEALVEERVAQLEVISHRRNELLREMYRMMRRRQNAGSTSMIAKSLWHHPPDWFVNVLIPASPDSGMVSNILPSELCATSSSPIAGEFKLIELPDVIDADSPMSEPPASPRSESSVLLQVPESDDPLAASIPEGSPPRATPVSHKRPRPDDEPDELNLVALSRSPSQRSVSHRSQSLTHCTPRSKSRTFSPRSPQPVNAALDEASEVQEVLVDLEERMDVSMEEAREPSPDLILPSSSPVQKITPRTVVYTTVDVASIQPSLLIPTPTSPVADPAFSFDEADSEPPDEIPSAASTPVEASRNQNQNQQQQKHHHFNPAYSLPPIKSLPPEYIRKGKSAKQKKRDKERDKADGKIKDEWTPMGLTKWGATIRANPVWKKVSRATKCLSTREWGVAIAELRLTRALERVESLENVAKWSYRQPKRQKNLGGLTKTHWDYLMDEMKWMRVDFREERRWKYVLAFNLSTAVLEWHDAGSREERVRLGICVLWKRPRSSQNAPAEDVDIDSRPAEHNRYTPMADESDGDEEEGEAEQRDIADALESRNALEEALDGTGSNESTDSSQHQTPGPDHVQPKVEDVEDPSALQDSNMMKVDTQQEDQAKVENDDQTGLKADSADPNLASQQNTQSDAAPTESSSKASKASLYAPLREQIAYSDERKLFLDDDDLVLVKALCDLTTDDSGIEPSLPIPDLSDIFPDLQPLDMPDVASGSNEGKKKDKRSGEDNRRVEDAGFTKMAPLGRFMHCKPTLLGPLQPARHWVNGEWMFAEEAAVAVDFDSAIGKTVDDTASDLFEGSRPSAVGSLGLPSKDGKKRSEHLWSSDEDSLLKTLVERYPNNWLLVADSFNSSRVTISTDKRTPWECFERWSSRLGSGHRLHPDVNSPVNTERTPPPASTSAQGQMTTRGVKRLATGLTSDAKKRRRHTFMYETMRKAAKKREAAQKASMNQRKASNVHDTHGQYQKMPKLTPAELSRMKYEKESREQQELLLARRRHEELTRQAMMQRDPRLQAAAAAAGQPQQAAVAAAAAAAAQQQQPNGTPRPAAQPAQAVAQIRNQPVAQVNISQQQRMPTPMASAAVPGARISPQHLLQAQAVQARAIAAAAQAQAQAQSQSQSQAPVQGSPVPTINGLPAGAHLPPPYQSRAATSSPGAAPQATPPRNIGTPSNAVSPRPPSAQPQLPMQPQMPVNVVPRQAHYFPVVATLPGGHFTQEQMDQALRLMQHRTMAQAQQNSQYPSQT